MKIKTKEVTSKKKSLGEVEYKEYDSIAEAVEDMGEPAALENLNAQVKTNAMNRFRSQKTGTPSRADLQAEAISEILKRDPEAFSRHRGDSAAIGNLIAEEVERLKKVYESRAEADSQNEDDENED